MLVVEWWTPTQGLRGSSASDPPPPRQSVTSSRPAVDGSLSFLGSVSIITWHETVQPHLARGTGCVRRVASAGLRPPSGLVGARVVPPDALYDSFALILTTARLVDWAD